MITDGQASNFCNNEVDYGLSYFLVDPSSRCVNLTSPMNPYSESIRSKSIASNSPRPTLGCIIGQTNRTYVRMRSMKAALFFWKALFCTLLSDDILALQSQTLLTSSCCSNDCRWIFDILSCKDRRRCIAASDIRNRLMLFSALATDEQSWICPVGFSSDE